MGACGVQYVGCSKPPTYIWQGALWRYLIAWLAFACSSHRQLLIREMAAAHIAVVKKLIDVFLHLKNALEFYYNS